MTRNEKRRLAACDAASQSEKKRFPLKWVILAAAIALTVGAIAVYFIFFFQKPFASIARTEKEAEVVLLLDGSTEVPYDVYRYFFKNLKESTDLTGLSDAEAYDLLHEKTLREIAELYAVFSYAESLSVTADTGDAKKMLDELLLLTRYGGSRFGYTLSGFSDFESYKSFLTDNHMSDAVYRLTMAEIACEYYAAAAFTADAQNTVGLEEEDILAFFRDDTEARRMTFCYIAYDQFLSEPNHKAYTKSRAITVYNNLLAKADSEQYIPLSDFQGIAIQNSITVSTSSIENGIYVGRYDSDTVYADVVDELFSLAPGEMSGLIETDEGFFVIRRMEPSEAYLEDPENDVLLKNTYLSNRFYEKIHEESQRLYATFTVQGSLLTQPKDPESIQ